MLSRAAMGCGLSRHSYETVFGSDAFDSGNGHLTLAVLPNSTAEDYAQEHGFRYVYLEPESDIEVPDYKENPAVP